MALGRAARFMAARTGYPRPAADPGVSPGGLTGVSLGPGGAPHPPPIFAARPGAPTWHRLVPQPNHAAPAGAVWKLWTGSRDAGPRMRVPHRAFPDVPNSQTVRGIGIKAFVRIRRQSGVTQHRSGASPGHETHALTRRACRTGVRPDPESSVPGSVQRADLRAGQAAGRVETGKMEARAVLHGGAW